MLEGSHGVQRDAEAAVALLKELVSKNRDTDAMWILGVCCEYGIGTKQQVHRAKNLYEAAEQQGNATAALFTYYLKNTIGRGDTQLVLRSEQVFRKHLVPKMEWEVKKQTMVSR